MRNFFRLSFATKACIDNWEKKLVKQQYLFHMSPQYGELLPTNGWDLFRSLGNPTPQQSSTGFASWLCYCSDVTQGGQQNFARYVWPSPGLVHYIYTFLGGSCPLTKFCRLQNSLRPSFAFSCFGSITARHSSSGHQPNFVPWYKEWNYRTFADGARYIRHHVGHRPTF